MDMTSGLPDYTTQAFIDDFVADPQREFTTDELIAYATAEEPVAEPGEERVYTNSNTLLLGAVVEEATGQPFAEVLTERILEPLGLDGTVYPTSTDDWASDTVGYAPGDDGLEPEPVNFSVFGPAGAMISTTGDLAGWGEALATGELVDEATQTERLEGGVLEEGPEYDLYAAGVGELDGWWGHTGEGFGYTALVMHDVDTDTTVVIAMNASQLPDGHGPTVLFRRLAPLLSGG
jgi:D-alanyl-D-alanine carboxypeptidase